MNDTKEMSDPAASPIIIDANNFNLRQLVADISEARRNYIADEIPVSIEFQVVSISPDFLKNIPESARFFSAEIDGLLTESQDRDVAAEVNSGAAVFFPFIGPIGYDDERDETAVDGKKYPVFDDDGCLLDDIQLSETDVIGFVLLKFGDGEQFLVVPALSVAGGCSPFYPPVVISVRNHYFDSYIFEYVQRYAG